MTGKELRAAREMLGLSRAEAAEVLETNTSTLHKVERDGALDSSRTAPPRVEQLYRAYAEGFRPANWPPRLLEYEARREELLQARAAVDQGEEE